MKYGYADFLESLETENVPMYFLQMWFPFQLSFFIYMMNGRSKIKSNYNKSLMQNLPLRLSLKFYFPMKTNHLKTTLFHMCVAHLIRQNAGELSKMTFFSVDQNLFYIFIFTSWSFYFAKILGIPTTTIIQCPLVDKSYILPSRDSLRRLN